MLCGRGVRSHSWAWTTPNPLVATRGIIPQTPIPSGFADGCLPAAHRSSCKITARSKTESGHVSGSDLRERNSNRPQFSELHALPAGDFNLHPAIEMQEHVSADALVHFGNVLEVHSLGAAGTEEHRRVETLHDARERARDRDVARRLDNPRVGPARFQNLDIPDADKVIR